MSVLTPIKNNFFLNFGYKCIVNLFRILVHISLIFRSYLSHLIHFVTYEPNFAKIIFLTHSELTINKQLELKKSIEDNLGEINSQKELVNCIIKGTFFGNDMRRGRLEYV